MDSISLVDPNVTVILFGSYARGEERQDSDVDLLVIADKSIIDRDFEKKIKYPLYSIEFNIGKIISLVVISRKDWERKFKITSFYENIQKEGIVL